MKRFLKFRYGEKGFTLIELLIVVAILGILAAVIIPNATGFMTAGSLNAANTEVANVKTAATGYMAENEGTWPITSDEAYLGPYFEGGSAALKAKYWFGNSSADPNVSGGTNVSTIYDATTTEAGDWSGIQWDPAKQQWIRS